MTNSDVNESGKVSRGWPRLGPVTTPTLLYFVVLASVVITVFLGDEAKVGAYTVGAFFGVIFLVYSARKFATGQARFGDVEYQIGFTVVFLGLGLDEIGPQWMRLGILGLGLLLVFAEMAARKSRGQTTS